MKMTRKLLLPALFLISAVVSTASAQEKSAAPAASASRTPAATVPAAAAAKSVARGPQKIEKEGVEVEFTIEPVAGSGEPSELMEAKEATVRFKIIDKATKTPLSGVKPAVWLTQRGADATTLEQCREKVQSFLQGSLRSRPDVDLNSYYLLALNDEPNISVIDPLLGFGSSKLLTLVMLKSPGADWAQTAAGDKLFVSMPLVNQVAVVDTATWKVVANIDTGAQPTRVRLQPDEKYLWVGADGAGAEGGGVTVIDTTTLKAVARVATGDGHHEFAFADDNQFAFVTNRESGTLSVVDVRKLAKVADVKTGAPVTAVGYSRLGGALYVVNGAEGSLTVVDARSRQVSGRIQLKPGVTGVRFAPGGRWGFVTNPSQNTVDIFDASTNRLKHTVAVEKGPDQVAFTNAFAYIRSTGSTEVTMIRLSTVENRPDLVKFPGGQNAPEKSSGGAGVSDQIVPAPEGNSVLVANPADKVIYYYSEGMAAPMGSFQNYRRNPRALMVIDRSLREVTAGVYSTTTKLPKRGVYDVAFLLDSPRLTHCFEAEAKPNPAVRPERQVALRIEYLNEKRSLRVGETYKLRFKLTETATLRAKSDLRDVRVLTFLAPGIWQRRDFARPVGDGVYELDINVPQTGVYMVFVESESQGVAFRQLPYMTLQAAAASAQTAR